MKHVNSVAAAVLLAACGMALAQPAVDGRLKPEYGPAVWFNTAPTRFGNAVTEFPPPNPCTCTPVGQSLRVALNNNNRAGVTGTTAVLADVQAVTTGYELRVDLADLGIPDSGPAPASLRIGGFITSGDLLFASNQVIGGVGGAGNLADPRSVNFGSIAGDQFITVPVEGALIGVGPVVDGSKDAAFYDAAATSAQFFQNTPTGFGDANNPIETLYTANGSEIANVFARVVTESGVRRLYLFVGGNLEGNFNKLNLFVDTGASGGQNVISNDACTGTGIFDPVTRFGPCSTCTPVRPGLTFDAGFAANYYIQLRTGGNNQFADFGRLRTGPADRGWSRNISQTGSGSNPGAPVTPTSTAGVENVLVASANPCPPGDPQTPSTDYAAGSEINGVYTMICGIGPEAYLHVLITGNLQNNGNRLDLFFDAGTANVGTVDIPNIPSIGQNQLAGNSVRVDFNGLNRYGPFTFTDNTDPNNPVVVTEPGLRFSDTFFADYWVSMRIAGDTTPELGAWAARINSFGAVSDGNTTNPNLFEYGSFRFIGRGVQPYPAPLVFDGQGCVRFGDPSTPCAPTAAGTNCVPNGSGTVLNPGPNPVPGIDIQGNTSDPNNPLLACVIAEPYSSFAPRLISRNPFDPLGTQPGATNLAIPGLLSVNINNSNRAGVLGSGDTDAATLSPQLARRVTTGMEIRVRLDELGWDGVSPIKIAGWITSGDHGFVSNQVIGGRLPDNQGNLANPRLIDFQAASFSQNNGSGPFYVTVVPGSCSTAPTGACCFGTACSTMTAAQCLQAQGSFVSSVTACTPTICGLTPPAIANAFADPGSGCPTTTINLNVVVTPGSDPVSSVTVDLSAIGGPAAFALSNGGSGNTFAGVNSAGVSVAPGLKALPVTVTAGSLTATGSIGYTVLACGPTATGSASPASAAPGASSMLSVTVTPGIPAAGPYTVSGDFSSIGGASSVSFSGSGTSFSVSQAVGAGQAAGARSIPYTVTDSAGRLFSGTIAFTVDAAASTIVCCRGSTCSIVTSAGDCTTAASPVVGSVISAAAACGVNNAPTPATGCCFADFNKLGGVTIDDIFIYLNAWFAPSPFANVGEPGTPNIDDIFIFLNAWFAGCPTP